MIFRGGGPGGDRNPRAMERPGFGESLDTDPYYSNFSDGPQSRDYRHGLGKAPLSRTHKATTHIIVRSFSISECEMALN